MQIESSRHEVTQGGHGGGWNDSTSIDKVSQYNIQVPIRSLNGFTVEQYWPFKTNTDRNSMYAAKAINLIQFQYQYNTSLIN